MFGGIPHVYRAPLVTASGEIQLSKTVKVFLVKQEQPEYKLLLTEKKL